MLTSNDLKNMRQTQTGYMLDTCVVLSYAAGSLNEYNEADAPTYATQTACACGLDMRSGSERRGLDMTTVQYDAALRLSISTNVKETDRVQIATRFGEAITPLTYEIVSPIQRGPSGIRLLLRKIVV